MLTFILGYVFGYLDGRYPNWAERSFAFFCQFLLFPLLGFLLAAGLSMGIRNEPNFSGRWALAGLGLGILLQILLLLLPDPRGPQVHSLRPRFSRRDRR